MNVLSKMKFTKQWLDQDASSDVAVGLQYLADIQKVVSLPVPGCITPDDQEISKDQIRTYTLAMIVECTEFLQTLDWKPWKTKKVFKDDVVEEFADILAFLGIIVYYLSRMGISTADLGSAYREKSIKNIDRFIGNHGEEYRQLSLEEIKNDNSI